VSSERTLDDIAKVLEKDGQGPVVDEAIRILREQEASPDEVSLEDANRWIAEKNETKLELPHEAAQFIAVYNAIVKSKMKFCLRLPQKVAILAMLTLKKNKKKILAQVGFELFSK
jgi:hypothetical protein